MMGSPARCERQGRFGVEDGDRGGGLKGGGGGGGGGGVVPPRARGGGGVLAPHPKPGLKGFRRGRRRRRAPGALEGGKAGAPRPPPAGGEGPAPATATAEDRQR